MGEYPPLASDKPIGFGQRSSAWWMIPQNFTGLVVMPSARPAGDSPAHGFWRLLGRFDLLFFTHLSFFLGASSAAWVIHRDTLPFAYMRASIRIRLAVFKLHRNWMVTCLPSFLRVPFFIMAMDTARNALLLIAHPPYQDGATVPIQYYVLRQPNPGQPFTAFSSPMTLGYGK